MTAPLPVTVQTSGISFFFHLTYRKKLKLEVQTVSSG